MYNTWMQQSNCPVPHSSVFETGFAATQEFRETHIEAGHFVQYVVLITFSNLLLQYCYTMNIGKYLKMVQGDSFGTKPKKMRISQRLFII
jgi:hypothetical protein